ncbi:MAG TPA: cysteine desulfurase NifS [Methylomirabilota bacterium]|nr:cysteine desulfurase NifS [Methylomirabilota bacterium]
MNVAPPAADHRGQKVCYLDNNATTSVAPEVIDAMLPYFRDFWGNASSAYTFGNQLGKQIEAARETIANLINADPREIIFTSCGTESNNTAIQSALTTHPGKRHVITTSVEHSSVLNHSKRLQKQGHEVTFLPIEPDGSLDLHLLHESIRPDTAIVSIMWANNETGVLFPIDEIAAICQSKGVLFHTDAVQVAGKIPIDVKALGVDMLSLSAHKLHAPKGIGVLYVRKHAKYSPYLVGGHQERGKRAGTENVPYIIGFGRAAQLAQERLPEENGRVRKLRDKLEEGILRSIPGTSRNGCRDARLPNTSNIAFSKIEAEAILLKLDQHNICASSGSACTTGSLEPSHVLTAMGLDRDLARGSLRFSVGYYNTEAEIDLLLNVLPNIVADLRAVSP